MITGIIADLLATDGYIQVNKQLIKKLGLESAVLIGELCAEYRYWKTKGKLVDDSFYSIQANIEDNTGLNAYTQRKVIKKLQELNIITIIKQGLPAKNYYKINFDKLCNILTDSSLNFKEPSGLNFKELDPKNLNINNNNINNNKLNNNKNNKLNNTKVLLDSNESVIDDSSNISINTSTKNNPSVNTLNDNIKNVQDNFLGTSKKSTKPTLYSKCVNLINDFTTDEKLRESLITFLKMCIDNARESGIKFYTNMFKGKLNKLKTFPEKDWLSIVNQTIDNGWNNFYEIKSNTSNKRSNYGGGIQFKNEGKIVELTEAEKENRCLEF